MDDDVQKILDAADIMKAAFKDLERRQALTPDQHNRVDSAANTFRWFEGIELSLLRAAFDPDYAKELEDLTREAKVKKIEKGN